MKNVAVILSGGSGSRFGGALPKQFTSYWCKGEEY